MKKLILMVLIFTSLSVYAPELSRENAEKKELNKENERTLEYLMQAEFSEGNLRNLLELWNVEHIDEVIKQTKLETGWYKSRLFRDHNNLFGMHMPVVRPTTANSYITADGNKRVANYDTWQSSVADYILYIDYYKSLGYSTDNYYEFLISVGYCELGSYYIRLLESMSV